MKNKVAVIGASDNPERYSFKATKMLQEYGHQPIPVGIKKGECAGISMIKPEALKEQVDILTLYVGPARQPEYLDWIAQLNPRKVIFNPGTESQETQAFLQSHHIPFEEACTLVLLRTEQFNL